MDQMLMVPMRGGDSYHVTEAEVKSWEETYPTVDVEAEIAHAAEWCRMNPRKMKLHVPRFLTNWFKRVADRGGSPPKQIKGLSKAGSETARSCQRWLERGQRGRSR